MPYASVKRRARSAAAPISCLDSGRYAYTSKAPGVVATGLGSRAAAVAREVATTDCSLVCSSPEEESDGPLIVR